MEFFDFILSMPIVIKIIISVFAVEWFVTHVRLNMCLTSIARMEELLEQLLSETKVNKNEHINEQRLLNLLIGSTARNGVKKDVE